jgi:hypothetical protein
MTEPVGRERAVRFLLGELPDDERDAIEERFFTDDDTFAELQEAEDDLADEYGRGGLSPERRARFEARFLQDEAGQSRVDFAQALRAAASRRHAPVPLAHRGPGAWGWAAAAVAALALAGTLVALSRVRGVITRLEEDRAALSRTAAEQEGRARGLQGEVDRLQGRVADLEERLSGSLGRVVTLTLTPGLAREMQPLASLAIAPDTSRIELTLRLTDDAYPAYRVVIDTAEGRRLWAGTASPTRVAGGGRALRVTIPAEVVEPGHYLATVEGLQPGQPGTPHADYVFRVLPGGASSPR